MGDGGKVREYGEEAGQEQLSEGDSNNEDQWSPR